jgi:hypothetical protein
MSSNDWYIFTLGWFIALVIDPIVLYALLKDANVKIEKLFEEKK